MNDMHLKKMDLNILVNTLPGSVYCKDLNGAYLCANEYMAKLAGFASAEEIVGKTDYDMSWKNEAPMLRRIDQSVMEAGVTKTFEETLKLADGTFATYLTTKKPLWDETGEIIGISGVSIDMVDQKRKELAFLQQIFSYMPGSVYWKNKDGVYQDCNHELAKLVGLDKSQIIGMTDHKLGENLDWSEEVIEKIVAIDQSVMNTGIARLNYEELPFHFADGKTIVQLSNKVPLRDENGQVVGILGISIDITDRKKMENTLKEAKKKAEAASQAKSDFIANMSHDLRTPITGILGVAQDLLNITKEIDATLKTNSLSSLEESLALTQRLNNHVKNDATTVINAINPLLNLFNEILETTRLGKGISSQTLESFDAYELITHNVALLQPTAQHRKLNLITEIDERVPRYVQGFRTYIDRTLINLIANALKFTNQGFVKVTMKLLKDFPASYQKDDKIIIQILIEDTGIGIPENKHETIFDHFSRLNASHEGIYKGTGLGLYTVKHYIKVMKGRIDVESEVGKGTCFTITLPFIVSDKVDQPRDTSFFIPVDSIIQQSDAATSFTEINHPNPSNQVLIVEDNAAAARAVAATIRPFNCAIDIAENGTQAIEKAKNHAYDIILMDVGLPDISGIEATKMIRSFTDSQKAQVPIIAITGHADTPEIRQECLDAGMQEVLSKPARPLLLENIFQRFVFNEIPKKMPAPINELNEPAISTTEIKNTSDLPLLDWEISKQMCGSVLEGLQDILTALLSDLKISTEVLTKTYQKKDITAIRAELHRAIGGVVYICAPRLENILKTFQKAIKIEPPNWKECDRLYQEMQQTMSDFCQECNKDKA